MPDQRLLPLKKRGEETEVVARREEQEFTPIVGPLGLWPFPLLNVFLRFLQRLRELRYREYRRPSRVTLLEFVRDREGRVIQLISTEKEM